MFYSNHRPILHRFQDKQPFQSKINFSYLHVFNAPVEGVPLGIGYWHRGQKNGLMGPPDSPESFKAGLAV